MECKEKVRKMKKKQYKYYNINIWFIPEVEGNLEDISRSYIREYIKELLNTPTLILSIPREEADEFFATNGYITKRLHSKKDLYEKWKALPRGIRKRLYYLLNKKLLEVLNDELQPTQPPVSIITS
jgi:hypothetical protein